MVRREVRKRRRGGVSHVFGDIPYSEFSELYDLAAHVSNDADPQYLESLRSKMQATSELVGAFVRLGGQSQANIVQDSEYRARQKAQTEVRRLQ